MLDYRKIFQNIQFNAERFGYVRSFLNLLLYLVNKVACFQIYEFYCLQCGGDHIQKYAGKFVNFSFKFATEADLLDMQSSNQWDISQSLISNFQAGDQCLLGFVNNQLAGYVWVHTKHSPCLLSGFQFSLPDDYVYVFAFFTLPEFRGRRVIMYNHEVILKQPEWKEKKGLIAYIECTNWPSKNAIHNLGYQRIGYLIKIGTLKHFIVMASGKIKRFGIRILV